MSDPTPQETAEIGGSVKTLSDIRFEKLEARLAQLEQINAELRQANAELYAYASQSQPAQVQTAATPPAAVPAVSTPAGVQAPAPVTDTAAQDAVKAEQDALIAAVKERMHYGAPQAKQSYMAQNTGPAPGNNDGM